MARFTWKGLLAIVALSVIFASVLAPAKGLAQEPPEIEWVAGPATVDLGDAAEIELGDDYVFLDGEDTRELMEYVGQADPLAVGVVAPKAESQDWSIIFSYDPIGYVKEDEKESLDSQAILQSIKEATEEGNKIRIERGFPALNVIGWYEEPHYDADSHNLVWVLLAEEADTQIQIVNYNIRLLGRHGVMQVILVSDPATLATTRAYLDDIIAHFSWKQGKSYAEWVAGDKVAEIGLTALIVGGAAAAATGLLGQIWRFLVAGVAAIVAAIGGLIRRLRGKRNVPVPGE